ncbi:O-succinylbenzoic acid--CoA ligase [Streptomonospora nanhaiensis]|uniref:O-succinylbenzoic acid--CoA ligase n=2 Tax=Streptomonospora nanhaiensis TaxID=1323731 RepID=A0A853BHF7_9ACTN|nr:AMP-binding protein [Streptomonospora nanhaiensis]NYI93997.1 O-succinylbenzoic acid--CoA ligase [Streptomonospora nanhaiensis]
MANRPLHAVMGLDPGRLTALLSDALEGTGPALLPIDPDTPRPRLEHILATMRPAALHTPEGTTALADPAGTAEDVAVAIATSGSTGAPKGVELTAGALTASVHASLSRIGARPADPWLCLLPPAHISGLLVLVRALVTGARPLHQRFDPATVLATARRHRPHVSLVPTQLHRLLAAGADLSAFNTILLGGAAAPEHLLAAARAAGGTVVTTYGMSETCGGCVYDGLPLDGVRARLDDDGRILLAGPALFSGYRLDPAATAAHTRTDSDGTRWFATSDLGVFDAEGRLRVRGRADDVINTGGHKVVAGEVAALLARLDSVGEAVVVGRPDPEWGQRVTAVVVPADPAAPPSLADLRDWVRRHLPAYAAPRELDLRAALPLLASGKPDLVALRRAPAARD